MSNSGGVTMAGITVYGASVVPRLQAVQEVPRRAPRSPSGGWTSTRTRRGSAASRRCSRAGGPSPPSSSRRGTISWSRRTAIWPGAWASSWRRTGPPTTSPSWAGDRRAGRRDLRRPRGHHGPGRRPQRPGRAGGGHRAGRQLPGLPRGRRGRRAGGHLVAQARRYGVEMLAAVSVERLERDGDDTVLRLSGGQRVCAEAVLVATGSSYRRLGVPGEADLIGSGVHFCATCDGPFYRGVRGAAGDRWRELGARGGDVPPPVRGPHPDRRVRPRAQGLEAAPGQGALRSAVHRPHQHRGGGAARPSQARGGRRPRPPSGEDLRWHPRRAFVFIGFDPNTGFLEGTVELDRWGFVAPTASPPP